MFFYFPKLSALENKIIFKINKKAFTSVDYEMRVRYLDFVGNNNRLEEEIIMKDLTLE